MSFHFNPMDYQAKELNLNKQKIIHLMEKIKLPAKKIKNKKIYQIKMENNNKMQKIYKRDKNLNKRIIVNQG